MLFFLNLWTQNSVLKVVVLKYIWAKLYAALEVVVKTKIFLWMSIILVLTPLSKISVCKMSG